MNDGTPSLWKFLESHGHQGNSLRALMERAEAVDAAYKRFKETIGDNSFYIDPQAMAFAAAEGQYSYAAFAWSKGDLVRMKDDGALGVVTGWETYSGNTYGFHVKVKTSNGEKFSYPDNLERADIPEEVMDLAFSVVKLKNQDNGGGGHEGRN